MEEVPQAARDTVEVVDGVHLTQLAAGERMSVQHYHFEPGASVPVHSHHHEQVGFVARGTLTLAIPDADDSREEYVISPGDSYVIPGEEPHTAENRGEEPLRGVDIFSPPRPNPDWAE